METKTLVIFLAGGVAGYLLCQYMSGKIEGLVPPVSSTPSPTDNPMPSSGNLDPKIIDCQNKLNAQLATLNLAPDKVQDYSDSFMRDCLTSI